MASDVHAFQWNGENWDEATSFAASLPGGAEVSGAGDRLAIFTSRAEVHARPGDWIVRGDWISGVAGELYVCSPEVFAATCEPVEMETP